MDYNFDIEIDRKETNALKWEFIQAEPGTFRLEKTDRFFGSNRIIPMWVADMDFKSPQPVIDALVERAQHGIYGYTQNDDNFFEAVVQWMQKRHNWKINKHWITITPGVVPALAMLVHTFVKPGEKVIIQPPVYYPFKIVIERNGSKVLRNALIYKNNRYQMDFNDLETKARDPKVKMLILCSPHNPVGRVWTEEELRTLGEICLSNQVIVVSDEIHGDLVYRGRQFIPFASLDPEFAQHSITCTSPSKTFNLAGLSTSSIIIPNAGLHTAFEKTLRSHAFGGESIFGSVALQAAYNHGEPWLEKLLEYLEGNLNFLEAYFKENIPKIKVIRPEGTFLVWLDCRDLGLDREARADFMMEKARIYLEEGYAFGREGEGFERINIACPRSMLKVALERLKEAVNQLDG